MGILKQSTALSGVGKHWPKKSVCNAIFTLSKDSIQIEFLKLIAALTLITTVSKHL